MVGDAFHARMQVAVLAERGQAAADPVGDDGDVTAQGDRGDRERAAAVGGLADHAVDVGAHVGGEVDLVDRQQVGAGDAGAALAGDVVTGGDVDDEDLHVGERGGEDRGQVVAAALDEDDVERAGGRLQFL